MDTEELESWRKLTNSYQDFQLYNLGLRERGKGPYVVQQRGFPAGSKTMETDTYLLNKEGNWEIIWRWVSVDDTEKAHCLFDSVVEVMTLLEKIALADVIAIDELPPGVSKEQAHKYYQEAGQQLISDLRKAKGNPIDR